METKSEQSLYERLGSEKGIKKIVDDIVDAHMENPVIKVRFLPYLEDPENLKKLKGHLVTFICNGTGGEQEYTGRDMVTTHTGMNISEEEYMAGTDDILKALDKNGIDEESKKDVLAICYSLKDDIMRV
ncbi:MAG: group 1 truncated hemoglobin [Owenweeksia sp.]|nr:group 1 truncated hemoglobin [Owenweeksia sp.]